MAWLGCFHRDYQARMRTVTDSEYVAFLLWASDSLSRGNRCSWQQASCGHHQLILVFREGRVEKMALSGLKRWLIGKVLAAQA